VNRGSGAPTPEGPAGEPQAGGKKPQIRLGGGFEFRSRGPSTVASDLNKLVLRIIKKNGWKKRRGKRGLMRFFRVLLLNTCLEPGKTGLPRTGDFRPGQRHGSLRVNITDLWGGRPKLWGNSHKRGWNRRLEAGNKPGAGTKPCRGPAGGSPKAQKGFVQNQPGGVPTGLDRAFNSGKTTAGDLACASRRGSSNGRHGKNQGPHNPQGGAGRMPADGRGLRAKTARQGEVGPSRTVPFSGGDFDTRWGWRVAEKKVGRPIGCSAEPIVPNTPDAGKFSAKKKKRAASPAYGAVEKIKTTLITDPDWIGRREFGGQDWF